MDIKKKFRFLHEIGTFPLYPFKIVQAMKLLISAIWFGNASEQQNPLYQIMLPFLFRKSLLNFADPDLTQTGNFSELNCTPKNGHEKMTKDPKSGKVPGDGIQNRGMVIAQRADI